MSESSRSATNPVRRWLIVTVLALGCQQPGEALDAAVPRTDASCAECDDGRFCNGAEVCGPDGRCAAGEPPCAAEECDETSRTCVNGCADEDGDGYRARACGGDDCDDGDVGVHPGAAEVCDTSAVDEDCDPATFGPRDADGDGYADRGCCNGPTCGTDCDDARADAHPDLAESCDGRDNDCDGAVDESLTTATYAADCDHDGAGDASAPGVSSCAPPVSPPSGCAGGDWVANTNDCDDGDASVHRGAADFCGDTVDSDCDPTTAGSPATWYRDADDDGFYGSPVDEISACTRPAGHARTPGDCDDADPTTRPDAMELCDGRDNDCDTLIDDVGADGSCVGMVPNATAVCGPAGACIVDACFTSFGDCNTSSADGCETDLRSTVAHCGACSDPCPPVPNSIASCVAATCTYRCETGYQDCSAAAGCESSAASDPMNCGACGRACPGAENAVPACTGGACDFTCLATHADCDANRANGCETDLARPATCGSCTRACPARPNAAPTCQAGGICGIACDPGFADCNATSADGCEIDLQTNAMHCSACGMACPGVANGYGACAGGACGFACNAGFMRSGGACVAVPAPRPISPLSTAVATSRRPALRWQLAAGTDGARIQVCADRACGTIEQTIDAFGTSAAPATDLSPGVHFWRLFGRTGTSTGLAASPTWEVFVPRRGAPRDASWQSIGDFNGDGLADLAVGAALVSSGAGRVHVYHASAVGFPAAPSLTLNGPASGLFGYSVASAGDVDGNGFPDLVVGAPGVARGFVYLSSASGVSSTPSASFSCGSGGGCNGVHGGGDLDGDGYADVVVQGYPTRIHVFLGSATGTSSTPSLTRDGPAGSHTSFGMYGGIGDVNGDALADLVVSDAGNEGETGHAYVYYGSASGPALPPTPSLSLVNPTGGRYYSGGGVEHVGDLDGDGFGDIAVGDYGAGTVYVHYGGMAGVPAAASATITSPGGSGFGSWLAYGGDPNADGFDDLLVANYLYPDGVDRQGRAYLYAGSASGIATAPGTTFTNPDGSNAYFGLSLGSGDGDGDDITDVAVGAYVGDQSGRVHVYLGSAVGASTSPASNIVGPDGAGSYFGGSLAL